MRIISGDLLFVTPYYTLFGLYLQRVATGKHTFLPVPVICFCSVVPIPCTPDLEEAPGHVKLSFEALLATGMYGWLGVEMEVGCCCSRERETFAAH